MKEAKKVAPTIKIVPLIARENEVIRNFFLLREVFIIASEKGVIFLDKCIGGLQFCNDPFVLYASIGDTFPAILAGLLMAVSYTHLDVYKRQISRGLT